MIFFVILALLESILPQPNRFLSDPFDLRKENGSLQVRESRLHFDLDSCFSNLIFLTKIDH
ncbi:hypothetical protein CH380_12095 [Leptospira adleri]|uniref:Uncharacterized protein n=1 Tax=Leptospira adleri TaxID=2023186 RepID=A0A2M9YNN0_9LEPT|nr:hypothetical protein CH380_12095 [Leptospira adleri]PJZ62065.1 hypothetical protein CH376_09750 [Leptospira adleri]